jgi:hypothetical protein
MSPTYDVACGWVARRARGPDLRLAWSGPDVGRGNVPDARRTGEPWASGAWARPTLVRSWATSPTHDGHADRSRVGRVGPTYARVVGQHPRRRSGPCPRRTTWHADGSSVGRVGPTYARAIVGNVPDARRGMRMGRASGGWARPTRVWSGQHPRRRSGRCPRRTRWYADGSRVGRVGPTYGSRGRGNVPDARRGMRMVARRARGPDLRSCGRGQRLHQDGSRLPSAP